MGDFERVDLSADATLYRGDCLDVLPTLADNSVDAIVTDPPAGIAFMGKHWDKDKGGRAAWIAWMSAIATECLRVLKPGGHALVWALPRTSHWTATAWEDAGFEVRDRIAHIFSTGFPKSLSVGKAIDAAAGAEREVISVIRKTHIGGMNGNEGWQRTSHYDDTGEIKRTMPVTAPATPEAAQWEDWHTALKPAVEDWWLLRKPLDAPTVAANVLQWGTGALNVGACRIITADITKDVAGGFARYQKKSQAQGYRPFIDGIPAEKGNDLYIQNQVGRFPANLTTDGSAAVLDCFPETTSGSLTGQKRGENHIYNSAGSTIGKPRYHNGDSGSAARFFPALGYDADDLADLQRFFYCAKASKADRDEGCDRFGERRRQGNRHGSPDTTSGKYPDHDHRIIGGNFHPTVKATPLMRWLCRLITPPGGVILDPFMGSGSTGKGALYEGFRFIGIEQDCEYIAIAKARLEHAIMQPRLFPLPPRPSLSQHNWHCWMNDAATDNKRYMTILRDNPTIVSGGRQWHVPFAAI